MMSQIERLLADLDAALVGPLVPFRGGLRHDGPGVAADQLLSEAHIARILAWYDMRLGARTDRRPALSIWVGWHLQSVLPSLVAANVLLDQSPRLGLDDVTFVLSPEHKAVALGVGSTVDAVASPDDIMRFEPLVLGYLAPLIALAAARTGLTERVLWSNAGHVFEALIGKLEVAVGARAGLAQARRLLDTPIWPDGTANRLFDQVRYLEGRRLRRVCCMRYLFPDGKICTVCPLRLNTPTRSTVHA